MLKPSNSTALLGSWHNPFKSGSSYVSRLLSWTFCATSSRPTEIDVLCPMCFIVFIIVLKKCLSRLEWFVPETIDMYAYDLYRSSYSMHSVAEAMEVDTENEDSIPGQQHMLLEFFEMCANLITTLAR